MEQGIETVRRDNCLLVRNVIGECLNQILVHRDVLGAQQLVRDTISDLLTNKLDLSLLVLSKVSPGDFTNEKDKRPCGTHGWRPGVVGVAILL